MSKKKKNFIQVISFISMIGVAFGTAALLVVLSVFNGLEDLITKSFSTFDPEIKISPKKGKTFTLSSDSIKTLNDIEGVQHITEVIEDNALLKYRQSQQVVRVKGVSQSYLKDGRLRDAMVKGNFRLKDSSYRYAIMGRGVQYALNVSIKNEFEPLHCYYPKNVAQVNMLNPSSMYRHLTIVPGGVFAIEKQFDDKYVIVPLSFAENLFDYSNERTAIEVSVNKNYSVAEVESSIAGFLSNGFHIKNIQEQHSGILRAIKIEKFFVYLTFSFILAIASFNIFFSLSMMAIDKRADIAMLKALGAPNSMIRRIFLYQGGIIAFSGAIIGILSAFIICWAQQSYGLVSMGMQTSIVDAYPVKMQFTDFFFTGLSIIVITFLAAFRPAVMAAKTIINNFL